MQIRFNSCFLPLLTLILLLAQASGQDLSNRAVNFDVPAVVAALTEPTDTSTSIDADELLNVVIPVSSEIQSHSKHNINTFRFDVFWNRVAYQVNDYSPRTQTIAEIQGEIATETAEETKSGLGLNLNADFQSIVTGNTSAEVGTSDSIKKTFNQLPEQSILVASGTSHRGTGVFFRFHRSSQTTLEGGRELTAQFQVPHDWRAGVLRVNCLASGTTNIIGGWENPFKTSRTFVVPVYRKGDSQAKAVAVNFMRAEQRLRQRWRSYQAEQNRSKSLTFNAKPIPFSTFLVSTSSSTNKLPAQWAHLLIQTGNDDYLKKYHSQLPAGLRTSAENFVAARQALYGLR